MTRCLADQAHGRQKADTSHFKVVLTMSHKLLVLPDDTATPLIDAIAGAKQ